MLWIDDLLQITSHLSPEWSGESTQCYNQFQFIDTPDEMTDENTLYLLSEGKSFVLLDRHAKTKIRYSGNNIIPAIRVIKKMIDEYPYTDSTFFNTLINMKGMDDIARFVGEMLKNPVIINDSVYNVLG